MNYVRLDPEGCFYVSQHVWGQGSVEFQPATKPISQKCQRKLVGSEAGQRAESVETSYIRI